MNVFRWLLACLLLWQATVLCAQVTPANAPDSSALPPPAPMPGGPAGNLTNPAFVRAVIVDSVGPGLKSADNIKKLVADSRAANFNAIIAQVRALGDAYYQSSIVPRAADIPADFDPLKTLLAEARSGDKPLKVYAMVVGHRVWNATTARQLPENHVTAINPAWVTQTIDGVKEVGDGREIWLDPGVAEVQDHLALVAVELVKNYEVDGILIDRLRYPDVSLKTGYAQAAVERFNKEKGKSGTPAIDDAEWIAWRRDQVTATLRKVRDAVKGARPSVAVGVDSITYGSAPASLDDYRATSDAYARALQDWVGWCGSGLAEINLLMDYKRADRDADAFAQWMRFAATNKGKAQLHVAVGAWLNQPKDTSAMMLLPVLDPTVDGVAVSSYHSPAQDPSQYADAFQWMTRVLDAQYLGSRAQQLESARKTGGTADQQLAALAAAIGAAPPAVAAPAGMPALAQPLPPLAAPAPPPGMPGLGVTALPTPSPQAPIEPLAPEGAPSLVFEQSEMAMPSYAEAAAPTPSLSVPQSMMYQPPPPFRPYDPTRLPGESNFGGDPMMTTGRLQPRPFVAPKIDADVGEADARVGAMARIPNFKVDYSDPNSVFVPKRQGEGIIDYTPKEGRSSISQMEPAPEASELEMIVLSTGKQFAGKVIERGETVTIKMPNGGILKMPASRIADVHPIPAGGGARP